MRWLELAFREYWNERLEQLHVKAVELYYRAEAGDLTAPDKLDKVLRRIDRIEKRMKLFGWEFDLRRFDSIREVYSYPQ